MALFRLKKDTEEKKQTKASQASADAQEIKQDAGQESASKSQKGGVQQAPVVNYKRDITAVLKHPRVTEKATVLSENGTYVFDVSSRATKKDVREAVEALYKVTPKKIRMVKVPTKRVRMRGERSKFGSKGGGKKAYVYVKKGDTIDIV